MPEDLEDREDLEDEAGDEGDEDRQDLDDGEFDRERAMATIRKQRQNERSLSKELKEAKARLAQLEGEEEKRKKAEMSEVERLQGQVTDYEARVLALEAERETMIIRSAVERAAAGLGFHNLEDAYHLADLSELEIDEDGSVSGVEKALKALAKERPYLIQVAKKPDINAKDGGKGKDTSDVEAVKRRFGI